MTGIEEGLTVRVTIRELSGPDFTNGFLETLASLAEVNLPLSEALEIFRLRLRVGVRTYVAIVDDHLVGTLTLLVERKFIHGGGRVGHIEDVAIHREYQHRGIGSELMRHTVEEARKLGCYKLILNCFPDRVPFYERLGFRRHDTGMRLDLS
jgi:glucosamine-phosphate N-acetyltransferase